MHSLGTLTTVSAASTRAAGLLDRRANRHELQSVNSCVRRLRSSSTGFSPIRDHAFIITIRSSRCPAYESLIKSNLCRTQITVVLQWISVYLGSLEISFLRQ